MARMIPPVVHSNCTSKGEYDLFALLKSAPSTRDWTVLHSLDIAHHREKICGELDFVVVIPELGILCLEVKGCRSVRREAGLWYYSDDARGDPTGPFKQAADGMYSLRDHLFAQRRDLRHIPFSFAVVFPYLAFSVQSDEWQAWQVLDVSRCTREALVPSITGVLQHARKHFAMTSPGTGPKRWFDPSRPAPTPQETEAVVRILRPSFECFQTPKQRLAARDQEVLRFTQDQARVLDGLESNDRVLLTGPAGTGKTVLALEAGQRARSAGRRCILLCYNALLGRRIADSIASQFEVSTIDAYALRLAGQTVPKNPSTCFWHDELPAMALERLAESKGDALLFDELILDEAQDILLRDRGYMDLLDLSLKGGLKHGRWRIFGDFEKQSIYGDSTARYSPQELLDMYGGAHFALRQNCRNTPRIAGHAATLARLVPSYSRVLRQDDQRNPTIRYYRSSSGQDKMLAEELLALRSAGFAWSNIVILSALPGCPSPSRLAQQSPWRERMAPVTQSSHHVLGYTTIRKFKGCEAPAVVLTDFETADLDAQALFYIGATRALHRLSILVSSHARAGIRALLLGG